MKLEKIIYHLKRKRENLIDLAKNKSLSIEQRNEIISDISRLFRIIQLLKRVKEHE